MKSTMHHIGPDSAPDRYRLLRSIGRGGEAVLYLAEIELDGETEPVVVKVLDSKTTVTPEMFELISQKWHQQAELLRFVRRPGVVGVREHFQGAPIHRAGESADLTGRALVLVMNYVDGLDLHGWRAERTLATPAERREVMRTLEQLADVLDWLHSGKATPSGRNVIHGDLSPGNVMVDGHGQATLVDFGLSKLAAAHQTAEVWFTPGYAAPEVFEGKRTPGTDRYAFGALAYFLLTGQEPPPVPEQLAAAFGALPQVANLPSEQRDRVLALASSDPARRPLNLSGWVKDLRYGVVSTTTTSPPVSPPVSLHDAPPVLPPPPPPTGPPQPGGPDAPAPGRRRRAVLATGIGVVLIAVLVTLAVRLGGGDDDGTVDESAALPSASVSEPPVTEEPTTEEPTEEPVEEPTGQPTDSSSPTASENAEPDAATPDSVSLTTFNSVAHDLDGTLTVGSGTVDTEHHETSLVTDNGSGAATCEGYAEYNLSREWNELTMVAGIDDASENTSARLEIEVDNNSVFTGEVSLGNPRELSVDVKNGLRLRISYADPNDSCDMGYLVLGTPTLSR